MQVPHAVPAGWRSATGPATGRPGGCVVMPPVQMQERLVLPRRGQFRWEAGAVANGLIGREARRPNSTCNPAGNCSVPNAEGTCTWTPWPRSSTKCILTTSDTRPAQISQIWISGCPAGSELASAPTVPPRGEHRGAW
jgi:hypothetical protein